MINSIVATGDTSNPTIMIVIIVVAALCLGMCLFFGFRKKNK